MSDPPRGHSKTALENRGSPSPISPYTPAVRASGYAKKPL
jgi:hypothetical protein